MSVCDFLIFFWQKINVVCQVLIVTRDIISVMWQYMSTSLKYHCVDLNLLFVYVLLVQFSSYLFVSYLILSQNFLIIKKN